MAPTQKLLWKLYVGVIGAVTTIAAQRLLKAGWKLVTGDEPPSPTDPDTPVLTAMSWALGLGRGSEKRPAAIIALSGFMPRIEGLELDLSGLEGYPVAIAHGSLDPVIPVDWSREARRTLEQAGADVLYRESPLPHTIDPRILPELQSFVAAARER